jgi:hypothetical protein
VKRDQIARLVVEAVERPVQSIFLFTCFDRVVESCICRGLGRLAEGDFVTPVCAASITGCHASAHFAQPRVEGLDRRQRLALGVQHQEHFLGQIVQVLIRRPEAK